MLHNRLARWVSAALTIPVAACQAPIHPPHPVDTRSTPATAPSASNPPKPLHGIDGYEIASAPPHTLAAAVAQEFARAWTSPSSDRHTWLQSLTPMCEPGFAETLTRVDPADVPARRIIGSARFTMPDSEAPWISVDIPTDAGTLTLIVAPIDGQWLVSGIDFRRSTS